MRCVEGSFLPCPQGSNCSRSKKCIPYNTCYQIIGCVQCDFSDFSRCGQCVQGFHLDNQICVPGVKCEGNLTYNPKTEICDCFGNQCQGQQLCSSELKECIENVECLKSIQNCVSCGKISGTCQTCEIGYFLSKNLFSCLSLSSCQGIEFCIACSEQYPEKCTRCDNSLSPDPLQEICECQRNTRKGCESQFKCVQHLHQCVHTNSCLIWPQLINNCTKCDIGEPRLCGRCKEGYIVSLDELRCNKIDQCLNIKNCKECVKYSPDRCLKCDDGFHMIEKGLQCEGVEKNWKIGFIVSLVSGLVLNILFISLFIWQLCENRRCIQTKEQNQLVDAIQI